MTRSCEERTRIVLCFSESLDHREIRQRGKWIRREVTIKDCVKSNLQKANITWLTSSTKLEGRFPSLVWGGKIQEMNHEVLLEDTFIMF